MAPQAGDDGTDLWPRRGKTVKIRKRIHPNVILHTIGRAEKVHWFLIDDIKTSLTNPAIAGRSVQFE
jgi:hypothetical protein